MSDLTASEVKRRCEELVYKVAYSFYDAPYIIILRLLVVRTALTGKDIGEILHIGAQEAHKYLGTLHVHRLVKRYANKEKMQWKGPPGQAGPNGATSQPKTREVPYWYLDYGEFADVAKYRIAMMRKAIDEKIKNEVGQRGYLCQRCGRTYSPLEISNTFDPSSNAFLCELCGTELIEDDPSLHGDETGGQDRMQRFNQATAAVRDALKSIEGARLPVLNIRAWIAQNVKSDVPVEAAGTDESARVNIVMGEEDDSEAKRKLADAQREQNALPTWHLTSTVTGEKTTLGLKEDALARAQAEANRGGPKTDTRDEDDALLAAHYANLEDGGDDDFDDETEEPPTTGPTAVASAEPTPAATGTQTPDVPVPAEEEATSAVPDVMVFVAGVAKRLADVTDADEDLMTPDEYEKYFEATSAAV